MLKGRVNMKRMKLIGSAVVVVLLSGSSARAQVNVAELLYRQACRTVAEQCHVDNRAQIEFPVTLHIGRDDVDTSHIDETTGSYAVHMTYWNESAFVSRVITLCLFRRLHDSRRSKRIALTRGRADALSSVVSVAHLQGKQNGANKLR